MKICCISDIHTKQKLMRWEMPEADVVVCTGDISFQGTVKEVVPFLEWYGKQDYKHKILIAGNHDWGFENSPEEFKQYCKDFGIIYLNDSGIVLDKVRFWGSPVTPAFCDWAFNRARTKESSLDYLDQFDFGKGLIENHWNMIDEATDVLLTHGPPKGILDLCPSGEQVGCQKLLEKIYEIKPKLCVFGHIHHSYGHRIFDGINFVNASICNEKYEAVNQPIVINVKESK